MNSRQLNFIQRRVAQDDGRLLVASKAQTYDRLHLTAGMPLRVIGRTSELCHASRQGWVCIRPSGRGTVIVLDCYVADGSFKMEPQESEVR